MNKEKKNYKGKKRNLIILTKEGSNERNTKKRNSKNSMKSGTTLALKGEDFVLKMNLLKPTDINRENILKTVISMKNNLISSESETIIQNGDIEYNNTFNPDKQIDKIIIESNGIENIKELDFDLKFNGEIKINKTISINNQKKSKHSFKQSCRAEICKTIGEYGKCTELDNHENAFIKNLSKFGSKSSMNEELIKYNNNNISVFENVKINNENNEISNFFDSKRGKLIDSTKRRNNFIISHKKDKNINLGNLMIYKNNFKRYQTSLNEYTKKLSDISEVSPALKKNNIQNIYNEYGNIDNISENKNLLIIKNPEKIINSSNYDSNKNPIISNKESEHRKLKVINSNSKLIEEKNGIVTFDDNRKMFCFICEKSYKKDKIFVPKCKVHHMCRKCIKNFYEEKLENNVFLLSCPFAKCNEEIDLNILKNIISKTHYEMLINKQKKNKEKPNISNNFGENGKELYLKDSKLLFNSKIKNENLKLYSQNHVIDINSNEKLFLYNKNKDIYCQKCLKPTLFTKIDGYFIKCLNCQNRLCKYCLKEFKDIHMDIMNENHCKVYYRKDDEYNLNNNTQILRYLLQLFYVFSMYYLLFAGIFYNALEILKKAIKFSYSKFRNKCLLYIIFFFLYFFSFFALLICSPFIVIIHPFFPSILSFTDY